MGEVREVHEVHEVHAAELRALQATTHSLCRSSSITQHGLILPEQPDIVGARLVCSLQTTDAQASVLSTNH